MYDKEFQNFKNPLLGTILHSSTLKNQWENEVSDFSRKHYLSKDLYGNDLRHQYAAAITARNLGGDRARQLGNLNEWFNFSGGDARDRKIDQINNEIGIKYGLANPNMPKSQLLQTLLDDHTANVNYRNSLLGE